MNKFIALVALLSSYVVFAGTPAADGAAVYFIQPADGATVTNPVQVVFGLRSMGIAPAGINKENTGHHHLLIDTEVPASGLPIPQDDRHLHFGNGQTETTITLSRGTHTLQLLLGDFSHIPHVPPVISDQITIQVQ